MQCPHCCEQLADAGWLCAVCGATHEDHLCDALVAGIAGGATDLIQTRADDLYPDLSSGWVWLVVALSVVAVVGVVLLSRQGDPELARSKAVCDQFRDDAVAESSHAIDDPVGVRLVPNLDATGATPNVQSAAARLHEVHSAADQPTRSNAITAANIGMDTACRSEGS